ncbi:MAG: DUF1254 domain-containing protein [Sandaracinaceae bacterium]
MTKAPPPVLVSLFVIACGGADPSGAADPAATSTGGASAEAAGPTVEALTALAAEAWVYGYPAVYQRDEMFRATSTDELAFAAPLNLFGSATRLARPEDRFVSVNNDTLYHMLQADVGDEPLVLNVPATGERYLVLQFVDAWTNNFAYLGTRGSGGRAGRYLLAGPGWAGEVPEGVTLLRTPTRFFTVVGRVSVDGQGDVPAARRVQEQTWVTPLSLYPERPERDERAIGDRPVGAYDQEVPEELVFWDKLRVWMQLNPPPEAERAYVARFEPLGLLAVGPESPYRNPRPELRRALTAGREVAEEALEERLTAGGNTTPHGWQFLLHLFDYNLDHFGVGTIDSDEWKIGDRQAAFQARAFAARAGLWGNHGYEAAYAGILVDSEGRQLSGEHRYELTFPTPPPVDAFWSVTMYDHPNYWLVDNAIARYSIGDRTRGLRRGRDGSLTIHLGHEPPPDAPRSNWLPAPEGPFRPILRMYLPRAPILDRTWQLPPIRRVDDDAE